MLDVLEVVCVVGGSRWLVLRPGLQSARTGSNGTCVSVCVGGGGGLCKEDMPWGVRNAYGAGWEKRIGLGVT